MDASKVQDLLRFLSKDAKVPLASAMGNIPALQKANLNSPEEISKSNIKALEEIFTNDKMAKQVFNAARRVSKKRVSSTDDTGISPQAKKNKNIPMTKGSTPYQIESSLCLPNSTAGDDELRNIILVTNRAPLVLAFAVCVLKYTMPEQPISSRLSLAQALVSANSQTKAISLGIQSERAAEEEGWGEGQPVVKVLGRGIRVLKRWDYDPQEGKPLQSTSEEHDSSDIPVIEFLGSPDANDSPDKMPPLWGVDLEALRNSHSEATKPEVKSGNRLPIFTAESARSYLIRSITRLQENKFPVKKSKPTPFMDGEQEDNVGHLLRAINSVCFSWSTTLDRSELDKRAWAWYLRVRPDVQSGAQGWGEKGQLRLSNILDLRRSP
ncbi:hypothetical protein N7478_003231 [Penicillium angulare]|uniref:uncharacterized protein n=1 Tax=Penicillium angulare TaxID=116970 RepID=UPI00254118F7|nr:uncharacterized protein N7478_003231 [Penicillium angulare]KAJ5287545.1 hypothetical protein N7478_003231 [Penicillium angulare]